MQTLLFAKIIKKWDAPQWIEVDRCKSIFIYGMKGIGKSYIAQKIAEILAANLDYLVWVPSVGKARSINRYALDCRETDRCWEVVKTIERSIDRDR
jgi:replication-associated recombination protein RarA